MLRLINSLRSIRTRFRILHSPLIYFLGFVLVSSVSIAQNVSVLNITTLAGASGQYGANDGTGSLARFSLPQGIAVDSQGNVYVADSSNYVIRRISPQGVVTTIAGSPGNPGHVDGVGSVARFEAPFSLAIDTNGNLYVGEGFGYGVRMITPSGNTVSTLTPLNSFATIEGIAVDGAGNIYVSDDNNGTVSRISPAGNITRLASGLIGPWGLCVDSNGNVYVTETGTDSIKKVQSNGVVTTFAGASGSTLDIDGPIASARFVSPLSVALDPTGNFFVLDYNGAIREISTSGVVSTVAGVAGSTGSLDGVGANAKFNEPQDLTVSSTGIVYVSDTGAGTIRVGSPITTGVIGTQPQSQTIVAGNSVTFSVSTNVTGTYLWSFNGSPIAGATSSTYTINSVSTSNAGTYTCAFTYGGSTTITSPATLTVTLVSPSITAQPQSQTVPLGQDVSLSVEATGTATLSYQWYFNGAPIAGATSAALSLPSIAASSSGSYLVVVANSVGTATSSTATITVLQTPVISSAAKTTAITGSPFQFQVSASNAPTSFSASNLPLGLSIDASSGLISGTVNFSGTFVATVSASNSAGTGLNSALTIVTSSPPPFTFTAVAGTPNLNGSADGIGGAASFNNPNGLAMDSAGNFYIADTGNSTIRKVTPSGVVSTFAGTVGKTGFSDGTGASAQFSGPVGLCIDSTGNLYVTDSGNNTIRKVTPLGVTTTIAGSAGKSGSTDGVGITAHFSNPTGIVLDSNGTIYVADTGNDTIRKITSAGTVSTIAGVAGLAGNIDSVGIGARFNVPTGLSIDSAGNLYVCDDKNFSVRKITPSGTVSTIATTPALYSLNLNSNTIPFDGSFVDSKGNIFSAISGANTYGDYGNQTQSTLFEIQNGSSSITLDSWTTTWNLYLGSSKSLPPIVEASGISVDGSGNLFFLAGGVLVKGVPLQQSAVLQPQIITQPVGSTLGAGSQFSVSTVATGGGILSYQWFNDGVPIPGATSSSYSKVATQASAVNTFSPDSGTYTVTVSNAGGSIVSAGANISVSTTILISGQPQPVVVNVGSPFSLSVSVTSVNSSGGTVGYNYAWSKNGASISNASGFILGSNTPATYGVSSASLSDAGTYTVVVSNGSSATSIPVSVTVNNPIAAPSITSQPQSATITVGAPISLSVSATGGGTLLYQWYENGTAIPGAASATYSKASAGLSDAASYTVTVSNPSGSVTSSAAVIAVNPAPTPAPTPVPTPIASPSSGGGGGGGGAPSWWFLLTLAMLVLAKSQQNRTIARKL